MTIPSTTDAAAAMDIDESNGSSIKRRYDNDPPEAESSSANKRTKEDLGAEDDTTATTVNGIRAAPSATIAAVVQNESTFITTPTAFAHEDKPSALEGSTAASLPPAVTGVLDQPISSIAAFNAAVPSAGDNADVIGDAAGTEAQEQIPVVQTSTVTTSYEEVIITTTKASGASSSPSRCGGSILLLLLVTILIWFHVILGGIWLLPQEDHALQLEHANRQLQQLQEELSEKEGQLEQKDEELQRWIAAAKSLEAQKLGWQAECREHVDTILSRNRNDQQQQ